MTLPERCAIYATTLYRDVSSIPRDALAQIAICRRRAGLRRVQIMDEHVYVDNFEDEARPALARLITACRNREVDAVIVSSLPRLSRNGLFLMQTVFALHSVGVRLVSASSDLITFRDGDAIRTWLINFPRSKRPETRKGRGSR